MADQTGLLALGSAFPEFTATDHRGQGWTNADLAGSWTALWWFPKADTPGCTVEALGFRDLADDFASCGVTLVGASFDTAEELTAFADRHGLTGRLIADTDHKLGTLTGALRSADDPHVQYPRRITYLVDPSGHVAHAVKVEDPANHQRALLDEVRALTQG